MRINNGINPSQAKQPLMIHLPSLMRQKGINICGNTQYLHLLKLPGDKAGEILRILDGSRSIFLSPELKYDEAIGLFSSPDRLRGRILRENDEIRILSKEELMRMAEDLLKSDFTAAIEFLSDKREDIPREWLVARVKANLIDWLCRFKGPNVGRRADGNISKEKTKESSFEKMLGLVSFIADAEINKAVVRNLLDASRSDPSWALTALEYFCGRYPADPWYHKMLGELNLKYKIYDDARIAFGRAIDLDPEDKELRERVYTISEDQQRAMKAAEKGKKINERNLNMRLTALWKSLLRNEAGSYQNLLLYIKDKIVDFDSWLKNKVVWMREAEAALLYQRLEDAAARGEEYDLARYFYALRNQIVKDIIYDLIKGHSVNEDKKKMIFNMVEKKMLGNFTLEVFRGLERAVQDPAHKNRDLCAFIYHRLYLQHFMGSQEDVERGRIIDALKKLFICYSACQENPIITRNIAGLLVMEAVGQMARTEELMEKDPLQAEINFTKAEKLCRFALSHDKDNISALSKLSLVCLRKGDYEEAISLLKRIIACDNRAESEEEKKVEAKIKSGARGNLGLAYINLYLRNEQREILDQADEVLDQAISDDPAEQNHRFNLIKVKLLKQEIEPAYLMLKDLVSQDALSIFKLLDLGYIVDKILPEKMSAEERSCFEQILHIISSKMCEEVKGEDELWGDLTTILLNFGSKMYFFGHDRIGELIFDDMLSKYKQSHGFYLSALFLRAKYSLMERHQAKESPAGKARAKKDLLRIIDQDPKERIYNEYVGESVPLSAEAAVLLAGMALSKIKKLTNKGMIEKILKDEIERLQKVSMRYPENSMLLLSLGNLHEHRQDWEKAIEYYRMAIQKQKYNLIPYLYLYNAYSHQGMEPEAGSSLIGMRKAAEEILKDQDERVVGASRFDRFRMYNLYRTMLAIHSCRPHPEVIKALNLILASPVGKEASQLMQRTIDELSGLGLRFERDVRRLIRARS